MTEREKVIKGLECRLDINGSKYKHCLTCDYRHDIDHCQWACQTDGILEDALALLKAQEPRVLAIDELRKLQKQDVVWLEDADKEAIIPGIVITALKKEWQFMTFTSCSGLFCVSCVDYGKRWRCWTSRPDQATREATPWN